MTLRGQWKPVNPSLPGAFATKQSSTLSFAFLHICLSDIHRKIGYGASPRIGFGRMA
jgi:hypothetical protein